MPATSARIEANRRNAMKSTGPRTAEGKARSRENGLKHGLTGEGVVMDPASRSEVDARKARLLEQLAPSTELGEILVDRIAVLSVRLEHSSRSYGAATTRRVREAPGLFDDARERDEINTSHQLAFYGESSVDVTPASLFRKLCRTVGGIDQLVGRWEVLRRSVEECSAALAAGSSSKPGERRPQVRVEAFDYLEGRFPNPNRPSAIRTLALRLNAGDASVEPELIGLIDEAIDHLDAVRDEVDPFEADRERAEAEEIALFDPSKEGELHRKYEARTERALFRAIQELRIAERPAKVEASDNENADHAARKKDVPAAPRPKLDAVDVAGPSFADVSASIPRLFDELDIPIGGAADHGDALDVVRARLIELEKLGRDGLCPLDVLDREIARLEANLPVLDPAVFDLSRLV